MSGEETVLFSQWHQIDQQQEKNLAKINKCLLDPQSWTRNNDRNHLGSTPIPILRHDTVHT